jgi:hypothetical protein
VGVVNLCKQLAVEKYLRYGIDPGEHKINVFLSKSGLEKEVSPEGPSRVGGPLVLDLVEPAANCEC